MISFTLELRSRIAGVGRRAWGSGSESRQPTNNNNFPSRFRRDQFLSCCCSAYFRYFFNRQPASLRSAGVRYQRRQPQTGQGQLREPMQCCPSRLRPVRRSMVLRQLQNEIVQSTGADFGSVIAAANTCGSGASSNARRGSSTSTDQSSTNITTADRPATTATYTGTATPRYPTCCDATGSSSAATICSTGTTTCLRKN